MARHTLFYDVPFIRNCHAYIRVPVDMTEAEADQLKRMIDALVIPDPASSRLPQSNLPVTVPNFLDVTYE
jgi:hypothetical protein